jgi:hypothetical protein
LFNLFSELNIIGILCEIAGFIILLRAIRMVKSEDLKHKGSFTGAWDELKNIMSTLHPNWNTAGIWLIIIGLILQLVNAIYT